MGLLREEGNNLGIMRHVVWYLLIENGCSHTRNMIVVYVYNVWSTFNGTDDNLTVVVDSENQW